MGCNTGSLKVGLHAIAIAMANCKDELNTLDGELGDGDLGVTMSRGMETVIAEIDTLPEDVGMALFACSKCFTKVSGSSYGTLLATGLMAAAKECKGKTEIEWKDFSRLIGLAAEAMRLRGKSEYGNKTVLDSLVALRDGLADAADPTTLATQARLAVDGALNEYKNKRTEQGRARMFNDKSIGMDDPGMLAMTRVVQALCQ